MKIFICKNKFQTVINEVTVEVRKTNKKWYLYCFSVTTGFGCKKVYKTKKEAAEAYKNYVPPPYTSLFGNYNYEQIK